MLPSAPHPSLPCDLGWSPFRILSHLGSLAPASACRPQVLGILWARVPFLPYQTHNTSLAQLCFDLTPDYKSSGRKGR